MMTLVSEAMKAGKTADDAQRALAAFIKAKRSELSIGLARFNKVDELGRIYLEGDLANSLPRPNLRYPITNPETGRTYNPPPNGWAVGKATMERLIEERMVVFGSGNVPARKRLLSEHLTSLPAPSFVRDRRASTLHLQSILGDKRFPNPKDHEVVMRWIRMSCPADGCVVDFFAGSGTTAEAVMRLNAEDGGTRTSISVTNNELSSKTASALRAAGLRPGDAEWESKGVFERVTRPRIETVVSGVRADGSVFSDGLEENVAFFKLTYEDENLIALGRRFDAVAPLLWMKAGGAGPVVRRRGDALWALPSGAIYGVLFAPSQAKAFAELIAVHDRVLRHIFVVTDSDSEFQEAVAYLPPELRLETTRLYADYLHSFEINGKG